MSKTSFPAAIKRFLLEEDGPTAVEYAVVLALIIGAIIGTVGILADETRNNFDRSATAIDGAIGNEMFNRPKRIPPARQVLVTDPAVQGALLYDWRCMVPADFFIFRSSNCWMSHCLTPRNREAKSFGTLSVRRFTGRQACSCIMPIFAYDLSASQ